MNFAYKIFYFNTKYEIPSNYEWIGSDAISHKLLKDIFVEKIEENSITTTSVNPELDRIFHINERLAKHLEGDWMKTKLLRNYLMFRMKNNVLNKIVTILAYSVGTTFSASFVAGFIIPNVEISIVDLFDMEKEMNVIKSFTYLGYGLSFLMLIAAIIYHYTKPNRIIKYIISILDIQIEEMEKENELRQI